MRVVALISGGKDSCYSMMKCVAAGHRIVALANLQPAPKVDELDSFMFQTVGHEGVHLYAEAMGLPLYQVATDGVSVTREMTYDPKKGDEVEDLYELLRRVKDELVGGVEGVASGAILSDYQRIRVENVCGRLGLVSLAYLWRRDQRELLKEMIDAQVEAVVIKVAAMGLTPDRHLGMTIKELYPEICTLHEQYDLNICGEGGEYETFTLDCPLFRKRITLERSEVMMHSDDAFAPVAFLKLNKLKLQNKVSSEEGVACCKLKKESVEVLIDSLIPVDSQEQCLPLAPDSKWVWLARNGRSSLSSTVDQAKQLFADVGESLEEMGCSWEDVVLVYLYLADLTQYTALNQVYAQCFTVQPPARVCVSVALPEGMHVRVEMVVCTNKKTEEGVVDGRSSMHVQSHSEWAPANIGPYSQAYSVGHTVLLAGQIGLDPGHMTLTLPLEQATISLHHVQAVLKACHASLNSALCGMCYYTTEEAGWCARRALKEHRCFGEKGSDCFVDSEVKILPPSREGMQAVDGSEGVARHCPLWFARVCSLPRGASVEWHFIACKSSVDISYSIPCVQMEETGLLTLQESWCSELTAGTWLAVISSHTPCHGHSNGDSLRSSLTSCFRCINSCLSEHDLFLHQLTMVHVWVPRYGSGGPLNYQDVQVIADSVSGGSVPLSVLSTEDYLDQNGRIAVHATRLP